MSLPNSDDAESFFPLLFAGKRGSEGITNKMMMLVLPWPPKTLGKLLDAAGVYWGCG
jgi:hypothetical protein